MSFFNSKFGPSLAKKTNNDKESINSIVGEFENLMKKEQQLENPFECDNFKNINKLMDEVTNLEKIIREQHPKKKNLSHGKKCLANKRKTNFQQDLIEVVEPELVEVIMPYNLLQNMTKSNAHSSKSSNHSHTMKKTTSDSLIRQPPSFSSKNIPSNTKTTPTKLNTNNPAFSKLTSGNKLPTTTAFTKLAPKSTAEMKKD